MTDTTADTDALVTTRPSRVWNSRTSATTAEFDSQSFEMPSDIVPYGGTG